ncbi:MAG: tetratricopeptide repeat protein [Planctomycetota bacterium]
MPYAKKLALLIIIIAALAIDSAARAEVVLLKDGNKYIGTVEDQGDKLKITTQDGVVTVAKDRVKGIYKDAGVILKETYDILAKAQEMIAGANKIMDGKERNAVLDKSIEMLTAARDTRDSIVDIYSTKDQVPVYKRIKEINETLKQAKFLKVSNLEAPPPPPPPPPPSKTEKPDGKTPRKQPRPPVDPKKAEEALVFYENALNLLNAKKYEEARDNLSKAISYNPDFAEAYAKMGDVLQILKDEELAYENFQQCIDIINGIKTPTPEQVALREDATKKTDNFRVLEEKLTNINKDFVAKLLALGNQCLSDTDWTLAEEVFGLVLQVEENNEEAAKSLQKAREELEKEKAADKEPEKKDVK